MAKKNASDYIDGRQERPYPSGLATIYLRLLQPQYIESQDASVRTWPAKVVHLHPEVDDQAS